MTGEFVTVAGNGQPTYIAAHHETGGNTDEVTLNEANKYATEAAATTVRYHACAAAASYVAGYSKGIVVDGYTAGKAPQIGQLLAFGTGANRRTYTVIESEDAGSTCTVYLDRPLEVAVSNDDPAFPGPYGAEPGVPPGRPGARDPAVGPAGQPDGRHGRRGPAQRDRDARADAVRHQRGRDRRELRHPGWRGRPAKRPLRPRARLTLSV